MSLVHYQCLFIAERAVVFIMLYASVDQILTQYAEQCEWHMAVHFKLILG